MSLSPQPSVYPWLVNTRAYVPGRLDSRAGIVAVNSNALGGTVHSLKRLNNPLPGANAPYAIITGSGTLLWIGQVGAVPSVFSLIDSGYSGDPLGFVAYRPPMSPESWLYISDSAQMRKTNADGQVYPQGIAPPLTAPTVDFGEPLITMIEDFNDAATTGWSNGGTAGALSANPGSRLTDTIRAPFNTGPGWVEYLEWPTVPLQSGYGRGMVLDLDVSTPSVEEVVVVSGIYPTNLNSTVVAILYDTGATGPCCIVPSSPSTLVSNLALRGLLSKLARTWEDPFTAGGNLQVQPNAILTLGSSPSPEDILVLSSTPGPLGTFSVRTSTVGTHAAGETLTGVSSFRVYNDNAHASIVDVEAGYFRSTIAAGLGTILNQTLNVDLSIIEARPTQPTDELHLSLRLDVPANLDEGRIYLDVDSAVHDFTRNYYYASFRASDLTPAVAGSSTTQAAIEQSISTAQIDNYRTLHPGGFYQQVFNAETPHQPTALTPASTQAGTGDVQWTELFIPVASLIRVGTDTSRTLADVKGVQISFEVSAQTVCDVHGLYLKGSYGPDVGTVGNDYYYRYRRRSSLTGAKSNPSPYNRSGIRPHSQRIAITIPGDDTEGDQLDVFRWGGAVTQTVNGVTPWLYVGSANNPGMSTPGIADVVVFNDDFADSDILNAEVLEFDNQQPYSTIDTPKRGFCSVVGTSVVWESGDLFNPSWAPGSIIEISGVPYTLYAQPSSTTRLEIVESATTQGSGTEITTTLRPSSYVQGVVGPPFSNPTFAFDANPLTAATTVLSPPPGTSSFIYYIMDIPPNIATIGNAVLSVLSYSEAHEPVISQAEVSYSIDGGATKPVIYAAENHGTAASPVLDEVTISLVGVTQVIVYCEVLAPGGTGGTIECGLNEIYLTFTYTPSILTSVPFILRQPTLLAQPMYAQWGPFMGRLLAVGDSYQPGVLHSTKPNEPDSGSDLLDVEITAPSEPLMNGCMYGNGMSFVWSNQRMFQLFPSSDLGVQSITAPFVPQEVPGSKGLFAPWFFCVYDKIYYGTSTGIEATTGGAPFSITDPELSLIFPKDGRAGEAVTVGSATFYPPDMTQTEALRLFPERNHIKFCYIDTTGIRRTIVYSTILGVWSTDDYRWASGNDPQISCHYAEEGVSVNRNLVGGLDFVYEESGDLEFPAGGLLEGFAVRMAPVSDFPGFLCAREAYIGIMNTTPCVLDVMVDGTQYAHAVPSTGGEYEKLYIPLAPLKGKVYEWALTSPSSVRLFLKDCTTKVKPWAGQSFQQFEMFRDLLRETRP